MKVYKVTATAQSYEDDISIVVVAENSDRALEIAENGQSYDSKNPNRFCVYWDFHKSQYPLIVKEIDLKGEQVIDVSNVGGSKPFNIRTQFLTFYQNVFLRIEYATVHIKFISGVVIWSQVKFFFQ